MSKCVTFGSSRASRPAAQSTPYGRVSPDSHWSLHAARASRADSADRTVSARSADEGLSALHCPRHWFTRCPESGPDRCNLESSNGHSRNPPLFMHSSSNCSSGTSSADCVGSKSPRFDVQTNAGVREARLQMNCVGPNRPGE